MSGIYLHIPFCRQACHYCDFHFSTSLKHKEALLQAMRQELFLRRAEVGGSPVETVYFGGGTPSLLSQAEIEGFLEQIARDYNLSPDAEITLEANPDDLVPERLRELAAGPVNRLSIGIQSFEEAELQWMNRAHTAEEALRCLEGVGRHFSNYSIDLIYGIPGSHPETWEKTLQTALGFDPPHISAYALTVEPATALKSQIDRGLSAEPDEDRTEADFRYLADTLEAAGYAHYEISNFGKPGYYSRNNTAYWLGKPYLGIGPSAHSYDGQGRRWNIAHNLKYIRALEAGEPYFETETLSLQDRYNEAIMTGLRTEWGVSLQKIRQEFGPRFEAYLLRLAGPYLEQQFLFREGDGLYLSRKGKFLADGIASDLFMINLK
jgi:oxygen-independent coproporphyrinogen-3 oxidase